MDRVLAAHKGAILGIDWIVGGERGNLRSWVCTGGVDRAVKACNYRDVGNELITKCCVLGMGCVGVGYTKYTTSHPAYTPSS